MAVGKLSDSGGAIFSECGTWRYRLERRIADHGVIAAIFGVNPSTAGAVIDDASSRKLIGFGRRLGWQAYILGNPFSFVSTDVNGLRASRDPIGPENDRHIEQIMRDADIHVAAWGALSKLPETLRGRWKEIVRIADRVGCELHCIGTNADGHPRHPLMTAYDTPLTKWSVPWFAGRAALASPVKED